ncbi:MAG: hypothetical protein WDW38_003522 [Sanguina aurantia]
MQGTIVKPPPERLGASQLINRVEYVRLIQQALVKLGYAGVAQHLEQESSIEMQVPAASKFQERVMAGDWAGAVELLPALTQRDDVSQEVRLLLLQQKYVEALEAGEMDSALACLRGEVAPLTMASAGASASYTAPVQLQRQQQLHHLAGLLLCPGGLDPASRSRWLAGGACARPSLLSHLQARLPPTLILPEGRLEVLIEQALTAQVASCQYHNSSKMSLSLLSDYHAGMECLPTSSAAVLAGHSDEVWHVAFSHGGSMLASASKAVSCCGWMPDSLTFLSGSVDKCIHMYDVTGKELNRWKRPYRIQDMAVSHNGALLVVACSDRQVHLLRMSDQKEVSLQETSPSHP